MRVIFLIDGFNLYGSIIELQKDYGLHVKWLDIKSLLRSYLSSYGNDSQASEIHYFTALQHYATTMDQHDPNHFDPDKVNRHNDYIKCLEDTGIKVHYGRFKKKYIFCQNCQRRFVKYEEKETDVAIGVTLLDIAMSDRADLLILVTGDTDIAPAVRICLNRFPDLPIGFCFPYKRKREELAALATARCITMKARTYSHHLFPNPFILQNGILVNKPVTW
ncbi:MAG: NYN domain-containing protein [Bacteroidales bacterium]